MKKRLGLGAIILLGGMTVWLWTAAAAQAHAVLIASRPATNAILAEAPTELLLEFSESIVLPFSSVTLIDQSGRPSTVGDLRPHNPQNSAIILDLPPLSEGVYLVNWRALSAVDGHTTTGSFAFGVGVEQLTAVAGATLASQTNIYPLSIAARWLNLLGLTLLLGAVGFQLLVWRPIIKSVELEADERVLDQKLARQQIRLAQTGLLLILGGLIILFVSQSRQIALWQPANLLIWFGSRFGTMWLLRLALAGAALWGFYHWQKLATDGRSPAAVWWLAAVLGLGLAITTALVSHSAALLVNQATAVATDLVHLLAATIWAGGLLYLLLALWQSRSLQADARAWLNYSLIFQFSLPAALSAGLLLLSGSYLAWLHVGSWYGLFGTLYGRILLAKLLLVVPILGLAAVNLLVIKPRLDAALDDVPAVDHRPLYGRFRRLVAAEGTLMLLVLLAAGLLTDLQRAQDAPLITGQASELRLSETVDDLAIELIISPALVGQNLFTVRLSDSDGRPVDDASQVLLRFSYLGELLGLSETTAMPQGDGLYQVEASNLSLIGGWQIEVATRRPGAFDSFAPFRLEADVNGRVRPFGQIAWLDRLSTSLTRTANLIPGLIMMVTAVVWFVLAPRAVTRSWQLMPLLSLGLVGLWLGGQQLIEFYQDFTPTRFLTNPILPDASSIAQGADLYELHCQVCHGPQGRGDGPGAAGLMPPPVDFTAGHTDTHPEGDLFYWIQNGLAGGVMPAFGDRLSDEEIWHLVNYVRRLSAAR
jgi:copper transport protein